MQKGKHQTKYCGRPRHTREERTIPTEVDEVIRVSRDTETKNRTGNHEKLPNPTKNSGKHQFLKSRKGPKRSMLEVWENPVYHGASAEMLSKRTKVQIMWKERTLRGKCGKAGRHNRNDKQVKNIEGERRN